MTGLTPIRSAVLPRSAAGPLALAGLLFVAAAPAPGQTQGQFVEQLNERARSFPEEDVAERVLIPAVAAMQAPPQEMTVGEARLLMPDDAGWSAAASWAQAEPQQAVVEAVRTVAEDRSRYVFALPYGDAAGREAIDAGFYTSLGDPALIARARHHYLGKLNDIAALVNVEATRLAEADDALGGIDLLVHWIRLARRVGDRQFYEEKLWSLQQMRGALERIRDLAYTFPGGLDDLEVRSVIRDLAERKMTLDRMRFPQGEQLAALQLVEATFIERAGPDPASFGPTLARLSAGDRPLRLFDEAALWQKVADVHAGYFDTLDMIEDIFGDWVQRWGVGPHDILMARPSERSEMDPARFALIDEVVPQMDPLFAERLALRTEIGGTQLALAVVGFRSWMGGWPDPIFAVRPRFVPEIPIDPYDPQGEAIYGYFVPIRDVPRSEREDPEPHRMTVIGAAPGGGAIASAAGAPVPSAAPADLESEPLGDMVAQAIGQWFVMMGEAGFSADNLEPAFQERQTEDGVMGPNADVDPDVARRAFRLLFEEYPVFRSAMDRARNARRARNLFTTEEISDLLGIMESAFERARLLERASEADSFEREFDESVFIVYSAGFDSRYSRAERVGPLGEDYLIWPPLLSLVREQTNK